MKKQLFVGLLTEGTTNLRFLTPIVERTIHEIIYTECRGEYELEVIAVEPPSSGLGFVDWVLTGAKQGLEDFGMTLLCVHADADNALSDSTYQNKILPALTNRMSSIVVRC